VIEGTSADTCWAVSAVGPTARLKIRPAERTVRNHSNPSGPSTHPGLHFRGPSTPLCSFFSIQSGYSPVSKPATSSPSNGPGLGDSRPQKCTPLCRHNLPSFGVGLGPARALGGIGSACAFRGARVCCARSEGVRSASKELRSSPTTRGARCRVASCELPDRRRCNQ
jgi:hypothetical protein